MNSDENPSRPLTLGETRLCPNANCLREYIPYRDKQGNEIPRIKYYPNESGILHKTNDDSIASIQMTGFILDKGNVIRVGLSELDSRLLNDDERELLNKRELSSIVKARIYTRKNKRREEEVFAKIFVNKKGNEIAIVHYENGKVIGREPIESIDTQSRGSKTADSKTKGPAEK